MYARTDGGDAEGELPVHLNPGSDDGPFGVMTIGTCTISGISPADAEKIIRAAARIAAFYGALGKPHGYEPGAGRYDSHCTRCGMLRRWADHAEPATAALANPPYRVTDDAPMCSAPDNRDAGYACTAQDGHDGPVHIAYNPHQGGEFHRWPMAAQPAEVQAASADREPVAM